MLLVIFRQKYPQLALSHIHQREGLQLTWAYFSSRTSSTYQIIHVCWWVSLWGRWWGLVRRLSSEVAVISVWSQSEVNANHKLSVYHVIDLSYCGRYSRSPQRGMKSPCLISPMKCYPVSRLGWFFPWLQRRRTYHWISNCLGFRSTNWGYFLVSFPNYSCLEFNLSSSLCFMGWTISMFQGSDCIFEFDAKNSTCLPERHDPW